MLPSDNRLKGYKIIEKVKKEGHLFKNQDFGVIVLKRDDRGVSRFAFLISKKTEKAAVHRNRVRRALREAVRQSLHDFPQGFDILFLVKKSLLTNTTEEIMTKIKGFARNTNITKS